MKTVFTLSVIFLFLNVHAQPGTLDKRFGNSGKVLTSFNNTDLQCFASAIQKDNKTVVVGEYDSAGNNFFLNGFLVLRYLPNGDLDKSFGNNGRVIINFGYDLQVADAVVVQQDGKVIITGYSVSGLFDVNYDIPIARLNTDGSLDSSFGNNGKVIADFSDGDNANSICLQNDGKIVIGGYYDNVDFLLIRYNTNGSLDSTFGSKGKVITMFSGISKISSVVVQPDGQIVAGGVTDAGNSKFEIGRYNSNGTSDSTFGINGFVTTDYGANSDQIFKIIIQPDDKIVAVGGTGLNSDNKHEYIAVARYIFNGNLDSTFGLNGKSTLKYKGESATGYNAVLQGDGKLVIAGPLSSNTDEDYLLVRLKNDGSVDSSFGTTGSVITDFSGLYDVPWGLGIRSDNIIVAAGASKMYNPTSILDVSLAAYNKFGKIQSIVTEIRHWLQHHNGIEWNNLNGVSSYVVQRSYDGIHFNTIATIHAGNTSNYTYEDASPLSNTNYYRLQTTSVSSDVNYSNVIAITNDDIKISPNPATNILHIEGLSSSSNIKLTVVDFAGNVKLRALANASSYNLNIASLKQGNYLLKIETDDDVVTKKFVKE